LKNLLTLLLLAFAAGVSGPASAANVAVIVNDRYDDYQHGRRDLGTDDRGCLEETLVIGREPVDARGQNGLHGSGDLDSLRLPRGTVASRLAGEHSSLDQDAHALLEEQRVTFRAIEQQLPEAV
jgi:hypothetical protein